MFGIARQTQVLMLLMLFGAILLLSSFASLYHVPVIAKQKKVATGLLRQNSHQFSDVSCPSLERAFIQTNLSRLLVILKDPNYRQTCAWIRMRVTRMWPQWVKSVYSLSKKQDLSNRRRRKVLLYLGFLSKKANWGFAETMFKGGALGELVVWSDLIASLYLLGHDVKVATEFEELSKHAYIISGPEDSNSTSRSCKEPDSIIYTDIVGLRHINKDMHIPEHRYKCRVRVFDCFGTEAAYNHKAFAERRKQVSDWGGLNLRLQQFYNMFPHTPDDTFLGFVVGSAVDVVKKIKKQNIAVVYGKALEFWKGKSSFLRQFHDHGFEVHGTVHEDRRTEKLEPIPDFIINHGYMRNGSFPLLLKSAKIFIGIGKPYEGPSPLEAIANGAVFINPRFDPPLEYRKNDKPTDRALTSQNPYVEQFMGEPYAYTVDIDNKDEVERVITKIMNTDTYKPFLPYEFSDEGLIQRINGYVEHQDFCHYGEQFWPPQSAVKVILASEAVSCKDACWENNLICEPSYFQHINLTEAFLQTNSIKCTQTKAEADIYHPSLIHTNNQCVLQSDDLLFSCVGGKRGHRRLCPCRTFIPYQSGLCKGCDR